ncbi:MAG TPA: type II toxin-antitoxin system PemK/MazF family toxin [Spirochaetota bacterium]|nr:type II toxin-antitoxin system PemK/MazF family toxin [Spirochaetota bacterium]HPI90915.1 type II toxin-antitoxin system PemK/MazF family toxin [Spirochaetota bacterium]HPR48387.1 type II toxin-antitoxin system PemK/MazF family toxin [Spirochaetota bacterium]
MEGFIRGDVVVIPFPYSDLTNAKRRPALVIANSSYNDIILCQITSKEVKDSFAISISDDSFTDGSLKKISNIRPNKIFTADSNIVLYKIASLKPQVLNDVIKRIIEILKS